VKIKFYENFVIYENNLITKTIKKIQVMDEHREWLKTTKAHIF